MGSVALRRSWMGSAERADGWQIVALAGLVPSRMLY